MATASPRNGPAGRRQPPKPKEVFDKAGCSLCGVHVSSSFRNCRDMGLRLCNACHCKAYRQKRKQSAKSQLFGAPPTMRRCLPPQAQPKLQAGPQLQWGGVGRQQGLVLPAAEPPAARAMQGFAGTQPTPALWPQPPMAPPCVAHHHPASPCPDPAGRAAAAALALQQAGAMAAQPAGAGKAGRWPGSGGDGSPPLSSPSTAAPALDACGSGSGSGSGSHQQQWTASQQQQQQQQQGGAASQQEQVASTEGQQGGLLADLGQAQQQALEQMTSSEMDVAVLLSCARRSRLATPGSLEHRAVLGILPSVHLRLPDDAPGLVHSVSCLLEAVQPSPAVLEEQAGDSQEACQGQGAQAQGQGQGQGQMLAGHAQPALAGVGGADEHPAVQAQVAALQAAGQEQRKQKQEEQQEVAVRLTVFAAAGAVACWHEAPACADVSLSFCPLSKAPTWRSGPDDGPDTFHLLFPSPYCPQIGLFAGVHRYVSTLGPAALQRPLLQLESLGQSLPPPLPLPLGRPFPTGAAAPQGPPPHFLPCTGAGDVLHVQAQAHAPPPALCQLPAPASLHALCGLPAAEAAPPPAACQPHAHTLKGLQVQGGLQAGGQAGLPPAPAQPQPTLSLLGSPGPGGFDPLALSMFDPGHADPAMHALHAEPLMHTTAPQLPGLSSLLDF